MARILIPTIADDVHAAAVAQVLERLGHRPVRWFCADFPQRSTISLMPSAAGTERLQCSATGADLALSDIDIFWNRRIGSSVLETPMQEGDRRYALREAATLLAGTLELVSQRSFAVNPTQRVAVAENKAVQLSVAHELGFTVPPTLLSNDPAHIRRFLRTHARQGAIFKTFRPVTWESDDRLAMLYTARVDEAALPADDLLRLGPAIFQACVPKACELRVTCMGDEVIAARLDSQSTAEGKLDWRVAHALDLPVTPFELPADVQARCRALLRRLGLVFGCIDFIVTPEGEYVFLEINQMGQFLWVEQACPEIPMLQTFCDFLLSRDPAFRRSADAPVRFRFAEVHDEALALLEAERGTHLSPEHASHVVHE
jgi:hypothetical protein